VSTGGENLVNSGPLIGRGHPESRAEGKSEDAPSYMRP